MLTPLHSVTDREDYEDYENEMNISSSGSWASFFVDIRPAVTHQ